MDSNRKEVKDKPLLNDYEIVGRLLMISAMSRALAKTIVLRGGKSKDRNYKGGGYNGRRKGTQHPRTKF